MPKVGTLGLDMMFRTCTVQVVGLSLSSMLLAPFFAKRSSEIVLVYYHQITELSCSISILKGELGFQF